MAAKTIALAHPGRILRQEIMEPVGLTARDLAKAIHVPLSKVNDVVREKRAISPELAVLLSVYLGTSEAYWINLQAHYDLRRAKDRLSKKLVRIQPHPHDVNGTLRRVQ
jgi:addiction module HigA family antidote